MEVLRFFYPATEEISSVVHSAAIVYAVAHDAVTETLYWSTLSVIYRANDTDGTDVEANPQI